MVKRSNGACTLPVTGDMKVRELMWPSGRCYDQPVPCLVGPQRSISDSRVSKESVEEVAL